MNQGGEPGHDDYGLPRVDIQIPDDARELYRDVQAYHRELRAQRRHERSARLRAPLRRGGVIIPLIAGGLILAMIAGMVLTMFTANPYFSGITGSDAVSPRAVSGGSGSGATQPGAGAGRPSLAPSASAPRSASPGSGTAGLGTPGAAPAARLPGNTIMVAGQPVALAMLTSAALVLLPPSCGCANAIGRLLAQARSARITVYLVGRAGSGKELTSLAPAAGSALLAIDAGNALYSTYHPDGLAVLLVNSRGSVELVSRLGGSFQLGSKLTSLRTAR